MISIPHKHCDLDSDQPNKGSLYSETTYSQFTLNSLLSHVAYALAKTI